MLGTLQRHTMGEQFLPALLVHCEGDRLQERALDVYSLAMEHAPTATRQDIERIALDISQASPFFSRQVADQLQDVPATIVHGDL